MIIKICGLKTAREARAAAEAGADMIGLNFYPPSPRSISIETAKEICAALPDDVCKVGLFVNEPPDNVSQAAACCGLNAVQLHGEAPPELPDSIAHLTVIRAFNISKEDDLARLQAVQADYFLLDAAVRGMHGGTGRSFDWSLAAKARGYGKIILAGGLRPDNVREAIRQARPDGVDVASGVETAPGVKSAALIRQFIKAARGART